MQIRDSVAIVTGAGSGLGEVIALRLAALAAVVLVVDIDADRAREVSARLVQLGGRAQACTADVAVPEDMQAIVDRAAGLGGPHVLVNNAGGWSSSPQQYPDADPVAWRRTLDLNLCAPMELTQRCLRIMTDLGGGAVVNISSSAGREANSYGSPEYAAAKAGLIRFTSAVADLWRAHGVRVNCVVPGWIGLPRAERELAAMSPAERARQAPLIPPSQVAEAVISLITDDRLSGRVAVLDGGEDPRLLPSGDEAP